MKASVFITKSNYEEFWDFAWFLDETSSKSERRSDGSICIIESSSASDVYFLGSYLQTYRGGKAGFYFELVNTAI